MYTLQYNAFMPAAPLDELKRLKGYSHNCSLFNHHRFYHVTKHDNMMCLWIGNPKESPKNGPPQGDSKNIPKGTVMVYMELLQQIWALQVMAVPV